MPGVIQTKSSPIILKTARWFSRPSRQWLCKNQTQRPHSSRTLSASFQWILTIGFMLEKKNNNYYVSARQLTNQTTIWLRTWVPHWNHDAILFRGLQDLTATIPSLGSTAFWGRSCWEHGVSSSQRARESLIVRTCHITSPSPCPLLPTDSCCPLLQCPLFCFHTHRLFFKVLFKVSTLPRTDSPYSPTLLTKISPPPANDETHQLLRPCPSSLTLHPRATGHSRFSLTPG